MLYSCTHVATVGVKGLMFGEELAIFLEVLVIVSRQTDGRTPDT